MKLSSYAVKKGFKIWAGNQEKNKEKNNCIAPAF